MNSKLLSTFSILMLVSVMFFASAPQSLADDASVSYQLVSLEDGSFTHTLNVVVPESLLEFYQERSHISATDGDFPKFVTPYALQPIADALREIYPDDEAFTNEVLTIIHQIPYVITTPQYYPVETIAKNEGDCDMLSVIGASILKAGGLDVTLLHYPTEEHMNIGVHLNQSPKQTRFSTFSVKDLDGVTYYVAESTSTNWEAGWRVGECPEDLQDAEVVVIPIEDRNIIAPGQVSASFRKLDTTVLSLNISPSFTTEGSKITVNGEVTPAVSNQKITLYVSANGGSWQVKDTTMTRSDGSFTYSWKPEDTGTIDVRVSWTGNNLYAGTTSNAQSSIVMPFYLLALIALSIIAVIICVAAFVATRKNRRKQNPAETTVTEQTPTPTEPTPPS